MSGIGGAIGSNPWNPDQLLEKMARSLRSSPEARTEVWRDELAGLCRIRVGKDHPRPQPIFSKDKSKCIVFFGECFDYEAQRQALERRGYVFEFPGEDAEFCLRLYEDCGDEAFAQLSGSYCFAIYDTGKRELLLVSDRLGTRPMFHGRQPDGSLIFATQVSALLCAGDVCRELDTAAVLEFCTLQRVLGTKTHHRGVRMLPPATVLRFSRGRISISSYWRLDYRPQGGNVDEYAEELAAVMRRSARNLARGKKRTAMLLSGGLDARMVVAAAEDPLDCYTFGDYMNPEAQVAKSIADARGFAFHFLERGADHYVDLIDRAVEIGGGMYAFNHAHALGCIEAIAQECDVITHGYVPELLFRGTSLPKVSNVALGVDVGEKLDPSLNHENLEERIFRRGYSLLGGPIKEMFSGEVARTLEDTLRASARELIGTAREHSGNVYDHFLWPDVYHHARYPSMLFELSMRSVMTERSMFFGNEVIDLHLRMPVELRSDNRVWLKALARLHSKVAHSVNANTGYSPYLAGPIVSGIEAWKGALGRLPLLWRLAGKHTRDAGEKEAPGQSPRSWPRFDWMIRNNPRMRQLMSETLRDPEALPPRIFDHHRVQALLDDHLAGKGHYRNILFVLLTFGRWHKKYGA